MATPRRLAALALCAACVWVVGCGNSGPKRYGVSGAVTYKGQPIKSGLISFIPEGSEASAGGASIIDGKYEIPDKPGLPAGKYEVSVNVPTAGGKNKKSGVAEDEAPGSGGEKETRETLPVKYNENTELRAEVKDDDNNEFNFNLK
jgi:hypothetical protein